MKKYLLVILVLAVFFSCSPQKRIQRLAEKHGVETTKTHSFDSLIAIKGIHFDSAIEKQLHQDSTTKTFVDTNTFILNDGTKITVIDSFTLNPMNNKTGGVNDLNRSTRVIAERDKKEIHIKDDFEYNQIEVKPPDKWDMILQNLKWFAISIFAIVALVFTIRKFFS